jgi:hypothetical protein
MSKKKLFNLIFIIVLCCAVAFYYISSKKIRFQRPAEKYKILADGFTIPGLLVTSFGLLMVISDTGTLDGVVYGMQTAFRMLTFQFFSKDKQPTYGEFKDHREEMRQLRRMRGGGFWYIVITGGVFIAIAVVFVIMYFKETGAI